MPANLEELYEHILKLRSMLLIEHAIERFQAEHPQLDLTHLCKPHVDLIYLECYKGLGRTAHYNNLYLWLANNRPQYLSDA